MVAFSTQAFTGFETGPDTTYSMPREKLARCAGTDLAMGQGSDNQNLYFSREILVKQYAGSVHSDF